ncbi:MAG: cysteine--tRNA ligase [Alphaproteobacteria bacterium]|nr:cysteine--tRNA ligase [Alphaproteobacteria bacterium]NCQ88583.1 cysteine--tRNA ligase [Alphaproteobacteria bacterium]NCT06126.1 cysteine--tRNA ligase [Alphaproteobacteria bacterium]
MPLKLYNSLTRQKEDFVPINPDHVKMYACGPTVYNYAHIGNARMAVVFDLWARVLRHLYPKVTYVSNITDVEDKIMIAAKEAGVPISEITEKYTKIYNDDMASLGVLPPDIQPKATEHIEEMIVQIQQLIKGGYAYEAEGHVLFHVPSDPSYGVLSGRSRDEQVAGARVEVAPYKRDPADFVLWKPSTDDQPGWDSPFGFGRPGWHIECSAMAEKHLGLPFDIHGGGADLKFPHHENEIAQSCCANGKENEPESFSKYWLHNGFLTVEGEKMSKSLGNFLLAHDLVQSYPGEVLRLAFLSAHYRQPLDWSEQVLHQNQVLLDKLYKKLEELSDVEASAGDVPQDILDALMDDLNTPLVMASLNKLMKEKDGAELKAALLAAGNIMGILQHDPAAWFVSDEDGLTPEQVQKVELLIAERIEAKDQKDFAKADEIRKELLVMGIEIKDTREGPTWEQLG